MILREYSSREWFRLRFGQELWEVHDADLLRFIVCQEAAEYLSGHK